MNKAIEKIGDLIYDTLKGDAITSNLGERAYTTDILSEALYKAGYRHIPELKPLSDWVDVPTKAGVYWLSPFIEGAYIRPRIMGVIDYDRPNRGLEVEYDFPHETIPVKIFVKEYYPKAKWMFIENPSIPVDS